MKTLLSFTAIGTPIPQGSMSAHYSGGQIRLHHKPELLVWRDIVALAARAEAKRHHVQLPLDGALAVRATFYLPRGKSVRRSRPCVKPDLDKLVRAIGDALSGTQGLPVIREDSRICRWDVEKRYAAEGSECGVKVTVFRYDEEDLL